MLRIWGRANSVNVKKVLWCCGELGLPFERIDAGLQYGVVDTPAYARLNPNRLVPTIEDDGFVLWESHAIVRYLCAKHAAGTLWPKDLRARADAERWMDWTHTFSREFQRPLFWALVRTPPEKRDVKTIESARLRCTELLSIAEKNLGEKPFLAGGAFTMADIPLGCHVQLWFNLPIERPAQPRLSAWHERLRERPAYRKWVDTPLS